MMKRLLTYGLLLLTILASHFVVSACQDDTPYEDTEVTMTFTTRAVVTDKVDSNAPDEDKMKDLRVIMLRQDGTVVDNHLERNINASSVTFTFSTPIQIDGEDFTFLAVANEESIQSTSTIDWLTCLPGVKLSEETIAQIKEQQIGDGSAFNINIGSIPQTKQWTVHVPQQDTHVENQTLDFVASKISVQFINNTNAEQSLNNIKITGIGYNVYGYLFAHNSADFVGENHNASNITFTDVTNLAIGATSVVQTYYTYPIGSLSSPTLYATWDGVEYTLPIELNDAFITTLNRNDHLQIFVTLTGQELVVNYTIAPWNTDNTTNIGSPTTNGGYHVGDWGNGNDIIIGGEIGGGDTPGGGEDPNPEPEPDVPVVPGDVIELWNNDEGDLVLNNTGQNIQIDNIYVDYITAGKTLTFYYTFVSNAQWYKIEFQCNGNKIIETTLQYSSEASSQSVQLTDETAGWLKSAIESNQLKFYGMGISITSICIE